MKQAIAKRWIKALRSGKYKQTQRVLKDDKGYCCLGVLSDLYGVDWSKRKRKDYNGTGYFCKKITKHVQGHILLPEDVKNWAGMKDINGTFKADGKFDQLTAKNDSGASFKEIASAIEEHWKEL